MPVPVIHQTDLFHPHNDPDDHWDLACQYALAARGDIDLRGVLLDYTPEGRGYGAPAVQAVAQMNCLTGLSVPAAAGLPQKAESEAALDDMLAAGAHLSGVNMVLNLLRDSAEPVAIHIVGSCRDIAAAARKAPALFREKCRALYLNAGASNPASGLEYNVTLDPFTYSRMFALPCPVYWMPCFDMVCDPAQVGEFGTFYRFQQGDVLPHLRPGVQGFFLYALTRDMTTPWHAALNAPPDAAALADAGQTWRNMWCTCGFLHAAGLTVLRNGDIAPLNTAPRDEVFRFEPAHIECAADGQTAWRLDASCTDRFIFRVLDLEAYQPAVIKAMRTLLQAI